MEIFHTLETWIDGWHWVALGLVLVGLELLVPSFTIIWFGVAAISTGIMVLMVPALPLTWQLLTFGVVSVIMTVAWFKLVKPRFVDRSFSGMGLETILGEIGIVTRAPVTALDKGTVRFTVPVMGSEEWPFICPTSVQVGDSVRVVGVEGHVLKVEAK